MTTQLLFGEIFTILQTSENQKWLEIEIFHDNYVGWIDVLQCTSVSKKYFKDYTKNISKYPNLSDHTAYFEKHTQISGPILIVGSVIPFLGKVPSDGTIKFKIAKQTYILDTYFFSHNNFEKKTKTNIMAQIFDNALSYLETPYLWGGRTIFGIDCSGFIQQIFRSVGYYLPRDAYQQAEKGKTVSFEKKKVADLAFFMRDDKIIHVGIVLENGKIIHARGQVRIDTLDKTGIFDEKTKEYSHQLAFIKRIL